jgi:hypothetical protein
MEIKDYIKFKTTLTENDEKTLREIHSKIETSSVTPDRTKGYITQLLDLIHRGLEIDNIKFLDKVFFDFHVIRESTEPHLKRIYQQLTAIGDFKEDSLEEQTHLVNLYRNIVSDAFDPYLNLVVATLQFIDGTFTSIQQTNLGLGERNKYEYAFSKLKPTNLFDGYHPIVRNAISHTGTEGIIYEPGQVVFRDIKRGVPPTIKFELWTNQVLRERILQLMDFIHAVDNCIEIVGFDTSDIIKREKDLSAKFFDEILTAEHRLEIHADLEILIQKILSTESMDYRTKLTALNSIFSAECKKRNTPVHSLAFDNDKKLVRIEVPFSLTDYSIDNEIIDKTLKLIRYGIIAVLLYKFYYENFIITETKPEGGMDFISVELKSKDLESYAKEEIGLYDILNDSNIYLSGRKIDVTVDFDKLKEIEYSSTDRRFPRRSR